MRHVTQERVTSHLNDARDMRMRRVAHERDLSHLNEGRDIGMRHVTYERVLSHLNGSYKFLTHLMEHGEGRVPFSRI